MAQTIKIDQLADTVMKGMEEYAKLGGEEDQGNVRFHPGRGAFQAVPADASFGVRTCEEGRRKDKGFPAYCAGGAGRNRAADKGY